MDKHNRQITSEPVDFPVEGPCYSHIREEVTDRIIWQGGPYRDAKSARWAAERQLRRMEKRMAEQSR